MRKGHKKVKFSFGELVAALFEETKKLTSSRLEQNVLVYAALADLLKGRNHASHRIALKRI